MRKSESLILPNNWGHAELPWPFSQTARHADALLKKAGYRLIKKSFLDLPTDKVRIYRAYQRKGGQGVETFSYCHEVSLPTDYGFAGSMVKSGYRDFSAEDLTWHADEARLPLTFLYEALANRALGLEQFVVNRLDFVLTVETSRGPPPLSNIRGDFFNRAAAIRFARRHGLPRPEGQPRKREGFTRYSHAVNVTEARPYPLARLNRLLSDMIRYQS